MSVGRQLRGHSLLFRMRMRGQVVCTRGQGKVSQVWASANVHGANFAALEGDQGERQSAQANINAARYSGRHRAIVIVPNLRA